MKAFGKLLLLLLLEVGIIGIAFSAEDSCRRFDIGRDSINAWKQSIFLTEIEPCAEIDTRNTWYKFDLDLQKFSCGKEAYPNATIILKDLTTGLTEQWKCNETKTKRAKFDHVLLDGGDSLYDTKATVVILLANISIDWMFIITRSLIAFTFVLIPTTIVFVIFYRRRLALKRERVLRRRGLTPHRLYSVSVIYADDPRLSNDIPPTYEDIYDTEAPPPCFCEAVAVAKPSSNDLTLSSSPSKEDGEKACQCKSKS